MLNVFVTDDEEGFFTSMQAHLYARARKSGIVVQHVKPEHIDVEARKLLTTLYIASSLDVPMPAVRHVAFVGLLPSESLLRSMMGQSGEDHEIRIHLLGQGKNTFRKLYNRLSTLDRSDLMFFMMDLLPTPSERKHNTDFEKSSPNGRS